MLLRIIYSSSCLMAVFGGYVIICGLVTTKYGIYGYYANILYWIGSIISSIINPYIVYYLLGIKGTLILGASSYAIYILGFNMHHIYMIMIASIINGLGSGLFRTNMNVWLVSQLASSDDRKYHDELYIGVYNSIFGCSAIISSIIGLIVFHTLVDIYWLAFTVTILAVIATCFIKSSKVNQTHHVSLSGYYDLIVEFWYIYPLIAFQGFHTIYVNSIIPLNFNGDVRFIMIHFLINSIGFCIFSHLLGWLNEEYNWTILLIVLTSITGSTYILLVRYFIIDIYVAYLSSSFLSGITESSIYYLMIVLFNNKYHDNKSTVFAYHRVWYSIFAALSQLFCSFVGMDIIIITLNIVMIIGSGIFMIFNK